MSKVFTIAEGLENMGAVKTGGQGSVYKGRRIGEIITAIKLLPTPIFTQNEEDKHYHDFANEVKKLQKVNEVPNPNIVKILSYGVSETGCFPYIEMEYIDGPDLGELLKPPHRSVFTVKEIIKVADHLSNALAHCHRLDVKHGDIKSNNVKYNQHTGNYVLLDFGLAVLSDEERRTSMRRAGAIEFMAPEQNEGRSLFETDVYSFGIILYELLAGKVPFPLDGNSETARNKVMIAHMEAPLPDPLSLRAAALPLDWSEEETAMEMQVPDWLLSLINRCLEKKPEDRFANGMVLHDYISHHRIYTNEVTELVQNEDEKWEAVVARKDEELKKLRAIVAQQEKELTDLRAGAKAAAYSAMPVTETVTSGRKVSRSSFNALLALLLIVGGIAVYSLFFNKSVVGGAQSGNPVVSKDSLREEDQRSGKALAEHRAGTRIIEKQPEKRRKQIADSLAMIDPNTQPQQDNATTPGDAQADEQAPAVKDESSNEEKGTEEKTDKKDKAADNNANENDGSGTRYKVRNKAYFHDEPDAGTRRNAFIVHWNNAVLKPLDEKNGFIYVVFTNHLGQTSKGWLSKDDLVQLK